MELFCGNISHVIRSVNNMEQYFGAAIGAVIVIATISVGIIDWWENRF